MKHIISLLLLLWVAQLQAQKSSTYVEGEIIVKLKSEFGEKCQKSAINIPELNSVIFQSSVVELSKIFPNHTYSNKQKSNSKTVDLSTIYRFKIDPLSNPQKLINQLLNSDKVAYAELNYLNELTYTPNDTLNGTQWYLSAIKAFEAWDIQQGDTNVVIAYTDTGTDTDHPDMVANYAYNYNDPINGIDDDNDGFIDNFLGWDVADNDNDVELSNSGHGINVGGLASAVTDNTTGISGAGFNTRLLPIKIDQSSSGQLTGAYEGIVYAADHGAFIITNSWGSTNFSQFSQDIINYATLDKGCLVIAATGNNGFENRFYPAAYDNVLSVGSLTTPDTVKTNSNYGYWTDIMAPGDNMLTTNAIGGYGTNGGTSMAAPVVAGIAGLVKAQFPNYTWQQITEQILNNADNIDAFNEAKYEGKIGVGRLNAFKAVRDSSSPGIVFTNYVIADGNDETFLAGDTLNIRGTFINWLKSATNANVSISEIGNKLQAINNSRSIGTLNQLDSFKVQNNPFTFKINSGVGLNETIEFEVTITADNYIKKQYLTAVVNVDYLTVNENNLTVTLTSDGGIGFSGDETRLGEGIKYKGGNSLLYEGSFIVAELNNFIVNKFRGQNVNDNDFSVQKPIQLTPPKKADFQSKAVFSATLPTSTNLNIESRNYVFNHPNAQNSIIYEYKIENTGGINLNNFYAGMILDWDIANLVENKVGYDPVRKMGISISTDTNLFCGVRIITDSVLTTHYAIDNALNGDGGVNLSDGFNDAEKYTVLSTNRAIAGKSTPEGNDIVDVNSVGPIVIEAGEVKYIAFVITIADSLTALSKESDTLKNLYQRIVLSNRETPNNIITNELITSPNPSNGNFTLEFNSNNKKNLTIEIYDIAGKKVFQKTNHQFSRGINKLLIGDLTLQSGIYLLQLSGEDSIFSSKIIISK